MLKKLRYLALALALLPALALGQSTAASNAAKLAGWVVVTDPAFAGGAKCDGSTDDTAAIQAAIATGKGVDLLGLTCRANNLTMSTNQQEMLSSRGTANLVKNANGPLLTISGDDVNLSNITFRAGATSNEYSGDNLVISGQRPIIINCGSIYASGRALKATNTRVIVKGSNPNWATTDATGTGYDIEVGVSGTATLYHHLEDIYSAQQTGGILLIDTGSHTIIGGQFGKLNIQRGTGPSGVNGGKTIGARILGNTTVEASSATFAGNQFSTGSITFAVGTSGIRFDLSNTISGGGTITNNGNVNNTIMRDVSSGSTTNLKIGDDVSVALATITQTSPGRWQFSSASVPNSTGSFSLESTTPGTFTSISMTGGNNLSINNPVASAAHQYGVASGGQFQWFINSAQVFNITSAGRLVIGASGAPQLLSGTGTPEAAITAPVGSFYMRTDGGAATSFYVKESGTGNTGWVGK